MLTEIKIEIKIANQENPSKGLITDHIGPKARQ